MSKEIGNKSLKTYPINSFKKKGDTKTKSLNTEQRQVASMKTKMSNKCSRNMQEQRNTAQMLMATLFPNGRKTKSYRNFS